MTERAFGWWVMASVALHGAAVAAGSFGHSSVITPAVTVPIEVVRIPAPEPPPPPPPPRVKPVPPRIVERVPEPKPVEPPPPPKLAEPPPPAESPPVAQPSAPVATGPPSAGALFSGGDLPVAAGSSTAVAPGPTQQEAPPAEVKPAPKVAVATPTNVGLTAVARPIGDYQVKPEFPESARKANAEGTTLLKVEVLANGRVGEIVVTRSSGRQDLDDAAIAAVKQWRFEPARRGSTAVAMWANLPVRFQLSGR
jgi:periplasmic protein TonB